MTSGTQVAQTVQGGTWHTVVFNCRRTPLDNKLVRQALNYSLDREKINQLAYFGLSPVTQSRYTPDNFWYYEPAATMYSFDLEQAKSLLDEAGLGGGFSTTIAVSEARPGSKALAQVWARIWRPSASPWRSLRRSRTPSTTTISTTTTISRPISLVMASSIRQPGSTTARRSARR